VRPKGTNQYMDPEVQILAKNSFEP